jgi:hypothetical protein
MTPLAWRSTRQRRENIHAFTSCHLDGPMVSRIAQLGLVLQLPTSSTASIGFSGLICRYPNEALNAIHRHRRAARRRDHVAHKLLP